MINSTEEYEATCRYIERLQKLLVSLRSSHSASQYESLSKGYLKELVRSQREIAVYLAAPVADERKAA